MDRAGAGIACLVRARPGGGPGGSERRGLGCGLGSCLGQSLAQGGCVDGGTGGGGWESHSHDSWSEGRRECRSVLREPQVLREVGRDRAIRILV